MCGKGSKRFQAWIFLAQKFSNCPKQDNNDPDLSCHFDAVVEAVLSTDSELGNLGFRRPKRKTKPNIQTEIWIQRESV